MSENNKKTPWFMLCLGPLVMLATLVMEPPVAGLSVDAWRTAGLAFWMASWWISEAVPIPAASLVPLVVVPIAGIASIKQVAAPYAHPLIFLFLGGFLISIAMERWNLHRRIALKTMLYAGSKPSIQVLGIMLVTAFLSMWMSNTATAVMMLPIALSVIKIVTDRDPNNNQFGKAMLLAIAYGASIGGIATLIGTPPNALMAAYLSDSYNIEIGFGQWMMLGLPLSIVLLVFTWLWLTKFSYKVDQAGEVSSKSVFKDQLDKLGAMSAGEKKVLFIFAFAALGWIFRPYIAKATGIGLSDTGVAMMAAILLFALPVKSGSNQRVLDWESAKSVPWGILILFGGGLALAAKIKSSGLAEYIALQIQGADTISLVMGILIVTALITFLTEITSNTATAAGFLPLLGPVAESITGTPMVWVIPAAIAASCAFMMPVATPPNAIVFGSGQLKMGDMIRAGFLLNIVAIALITIASITLLPLIFNL
ncbi:anion transporter [Vibrio sinaloensis]|uniref:SLC13 family permease n=1 Tax=Photobacterium sp. (strain ATCC 43367) TaxID=379097 RepID=UPI00057F339F|nr:DASS family sodium-coupled anion symporter [Vibrio sinaloensis]KIE19844.1 anion transporter [Vibrio sinaloensis]